MPRLVTLDHAGMDELLKSPGVLALVSGLADTAKEAAAAAPEVTRDGMAVESTAYVGRDRARAEVTIADPGGLGVQAKHGTLTRAVSAAGLSAAKVRGGRG